MRRAFCVIFFLVVSLCYAQAAITDEMLAPLDSVLSHRNDYMHKKRAAVGQTAAQHTLHT